MRQARSGRLKESFDSGNHASGIFRFATVRKELLAFASGAEFAIEDVIGLQADAFHLLPVGLGKINRPAADDWLPFGKIRRKLLRDFDPDFVTAVANTRSDSGVDVRWSRTEISRHFLNGAADNFGGSSTPPGMNSAHCPVTAVQQQNGHAIGSANTDASARFVR